MNYVQLNRSVLASTIAVAFVISSFIAACNPLRAPAVDTADDGTIEGELVVSRGQYRIGEIVEISFSIRNISNELLEMKRDGGVIQDIYVSTVDVERRWSEEAGRGQATNRLILEPGESSQIRWEIHDLDPGNHGVVGMWWSHNIREKLLVVGAAYGPVYY